MPDTFWQTSRRTRLSRYNYTTVRRSIAVGKMHNQLHLPTFNISTPVWLGASYITTEFICSIGENWSIKIPVLKPRNLTVDFCLAIRYNVGEAVTRYKLWENVGEDLDYPLYNGETLPSETVVEIWSTILADQTSLLFNDYFIPTSILTPANLCCGDAIPTYELIERCSLFTELPADLPITFNMCFIEYPIFIVDGDILVNYLDYYVKSADGSVVTWNSL